jgi:TPP-dependent pyruvate/acetoin dehydrogenase alpha subunit
MSMQSGEVTSGPDGLSETDLARLYRSLRLVRRVEEEVARIYPTDRIKSPVHLAIGQEAIAVGVCDVLSETDVVSGTYRSHAVYLAKGGDVGAMMAEMYGKVTGVAGGKGGSMHLVGMEHNILGTSAVVGTTIPIAVGYALALKREGAGRLVAAFLGDGATEEGAFYESLNFAALHKLPVLFVCENNGLAIHTPLEKRWAAMDLCRRVEGFGLPAQKIQGDDPFAVRAAAEAALTKIRSGAGPAFLECEIYRWREHVGPNEDTHEAYRSEDEAARWKARDPLPKLAAMVPEAKEIEREVEAQIAEAVAFAESSPFPDESELLRDVYAD